MCSRDLSGNQIEGYTQPSHHRFGCLEDHFLTSIFLGEETVRQEMVVLFGLRVHFVNVFRTSSEIVPLIKNGLDTSILRYQALVQREPACRLCLMRPAKVPQASGAKSDQRNEPRSKQEDRKSVV